MLSDFPYLDCSISSIIRQHLSSRPAQQNSDLLRYIDADPIPSVTIRPIGYSEILPIPDNTKTYLFATVIGWNNNTSGFCVSGNNRNFYLVGDPGAIITNVQVRFWYKSWFFTLNFALMITFMLGDFFNKIFFQKRYNINIRINC